MIEALHYPKLKSGRELKDLSANELRAKLIMQGVKIPETIKTKEDLISLVKKYS